MRNSHKLLNLMLDNLKAQRQFEVRASDAATNIYLYDMIDAYWGVAASDFVQALNAIQTPVINLHINSPGGDVFEARAMATAIRQHKSEIVAHIDGLAASAATYVATAARSVNIADGAFMMVHKGWTMAMGNADELRQVSALLDKIDESLIADYMKKTGKPVDVVENWIAAETWFTAQEAVDAGLADAVIASSANGGGTQNHWNLSAYKNAPAPRMASAAAPRAEDITKVREDLARRLTLYEKIAA